MTGSNERLGAIRLIVAHAVGLSPADMADDVDIMTTFAAGPREIRQALVAIEKKFDVVIEMDDLGERPTINSIDRAVARQMKAGGTLE